MRCSWEHGPQATGGARRAAVSPVESFDRKEPHETDTQEDAGRVRRARALAIATGGVPAVQANAKAADAEIEADEVIHACRHPNGGCGQTRPARPGSAGHGQAGTVEAMRDRGQ